MFYGYKDLRLMPALKILLMVSPVYDHKMYFHQLCQEIKTFRKTAGKTGFQPGNFSFF
jgi:hypothetical protein